MDAAGNPSLSRPPTARMALAALLLSCFANTGALADSMDVLVSGAWFPTELGLQEIYCHGGQCQECLWTQFGDHDVNPFCREGDIYDRRCEAPICGIAGAVSWAAYSARPWDQYWEKCPFFLFMTSRQTLQAALNGCHQNYSEILCTVPPNDPDYGGRPVRGGYVLGSELSLSNLDNYIDYDALGFTDEPGPGDWAGLSYAVEYATGDWDLLVWLPEYQGWGYAFYGSLLYWARLTADGCTAAQEEFALKCVAHSFVCWQSPNFNGGDAIVDLLGPSGVQDWPFTIESTPTFVYRMWAALAEIISLDVTAEETSISAIKSKY